MFPGSYYIVTIGILRAISWRLVFQILYQMIGLRAFSESARPASSFARGI
jgi:hypothetical protein